MHPPLKEKNVLIVDDDKHVALSLAAIIKRQSDGGQYHIDIVSDGYQALQKVHQNQYDLVITDYKMPKMTGAELIHRVHELHPNLPVIMMSAFDLGLMDLSALGKLHTITKPLNKDEIVGLIQDIVQKASQATTTTPITSTPSEMQMALDSLTSDTSAQGILLLRTEGYMIGKAGKISPSTIASIGTLVTANFMAVAELARILGNDTVFKASLYEGPNYNIYSRLINSDHLLAIIYGQEVKTGTIRFYVQKYIDKLDHILRQFNMPTPPADFDKSWVDDVTQSLDNLFS